MSRSSIQSIVGAFLTLFAAAPTIAQDDGSIVAWGENSHGQCNVPAPNAGFVAVAGGGLHSLGLKADGSIVAWGYNGYGQRDVPAPNSGFVAVAASSNHSLGLKADGSIVAWGNNDLGQCDVPAPNTGFVAVATSETHSLALKANRTIVAWGCYDGGQCDVPAPNSGFLGVAAGEFLSLGLKADGSIMAWGWCGDGQCNVPAPNSGFVAVAASSNHGLGLTADGAIVAWGNNSFGQCDVPAPNTAFTAVAGGAYYGLGLKADGSIVAWGDNSFGQCNVPAPNTGFTAVAGGWYHSLGLKGVTGQGPALTGQVSDTQTGTHLPGVAVSVASLQTTTGSDGRFQFTFVPSGTWTVQFSKTGYYPTSRSVTIHQGSTTDVYVSMQPVAGGLSPQVLSVQSPYVTPQQSGKTYLLDGVNLWQAFTATVDWHGHAPGTVRWIKSNAPGNPIIDPCPGTTVSRVFNMGADFGAGGTLSVVAVSGDTPAVESPPSTAKFKVVPVPPGIPGQFLWAQLGAQSVKYVTPTLAVGGIEVKSGVQEGMIPSEIPLFGGKAFEWVSLFDAAAEVDDDGTAFAEITVKAPEDELKKTKLAGFTLVPQAAGSLQWTYNDDLDQWLSGGQFQGGASFSVDVPPAPVYFPLGLCPICVPAYWRGVIEADVMIGLAIQEWAAPGQPVFNGVVDLDPFPNAEVNLGAGVADILALESYFGGGAKMGFQFPQEPILQELQLYLAGGIRLVLLIWVYDWPLLECSWDYQEGSNCHWPWEGKASAPVVRLIPRDYLQRGDGYATFVANADKSGPRDEVTVETPIQLNVFSQSTPDLAAVGDDLLLVWIYDDPFRTPTNRTEQVFSKYDATQRTWSTPVPVTNDGTADFHPDIVTLPNGDAFLASENVSEVLIEPGAPGDPCIDPCAGDPDPEQCRVECKLEEMKSKTEIGVAKYDHVSGTWGRQGNITANAMLDRSPRIATAANGTAMLTWVSNAANAEIGSTTEPNDLNFATYDGTSWSTPGVVASGVPSIVKSAMAYDGANAILLFIGDTDDDTQTPEDRELFTVTFAAGVWSAVTRLTTDVSEDANPQVAYDSNGDLVIVWYRDGDLYFATDVLLSDQHVVVDLAGASSGAADFRLATGPQGQIALVWQDASQDRVDTWYALYDPGVNDWTQPRQLTADGSMEHAMSPVFDASADLVAAYNKVQVVYESRTVYVGGEPVQIDNVPVPDQSDLYLLRHTVSGDLSVSAADVAISPANPMPGTTATVTASVHNTGDVPASGVQVGFYDGDPGQGGTLIEPMQTIAGVLAGGANAEVSVSWGVPASTGPRTVFVVVDPGLQQEDRDRTNNTASFAVLAPDVTLSEIVVQNAGPRNRIFTVRAQNVGALSLSDVDVALRRDASDGQLLTTMSVTGPIVPGAYHDVSWVWENPPAGEVSVDVYAIADEANAIDEFDENNNTRMGTVPLYVMPGDLSANGSLGMEDIDLFVAVLLGLDTSPYRVAAADVNGSGTADGADVQQFVNALIAP